MKFGGRSLAFAILGLLASVLIPLFLDAYYLHILISILFWGYLGSCWNILGGYAGQFSFGHAAFFGVGAYASSLLFVDARESAHGSACWWGLSWPCSWVFLSGTSVFAMD